MESIKYDKELEKKKRDLIGKKIEKLTIKDVQRKRENNRTCLLVVFDCDCGTKNNIRQLSSILYGGQKSCGCNLRGDWRKNGKESSQFRGCEDIGLTRWNSIKHKAGERGLKFEITIEFAWELFIKQNRKCALSGYPLEFPARADRRGNASLDRIDSSGNYTEDNVQWVDKRINLMKRDRTDRDFIEMCKNIYRHKK